MDLDRVQADGRPQAGQAGAADDDVGLFAGGGGRPIRPRAGCRQPVARRIGILGLSDAISRGVVRIPHHSGIVARAIERCFRATESKWSSQRLARISHANRDEATISALTIARPL